MADRDAIKMLREARAAQIEDGMDTARIDAQIALNEQGISGWGPGVSTETLQSWVADPASAPKSTGRIALEQHTDSGAPKVRRGGEPASNQFGTFTVHQASPKQIGFVKRLLAEKAWETHTDTNGRITVPDDIDTISKKAASALIDRLMGCPAKTATTGSTPTSTGPRLASDKQMAFLQRLIAERDYYSLGTGSGDGIDWRARVDYVKSGKVPTSKGASDLIDVLTKTAYAPKSAAQVKADADLELGMYRKADGTLYRVYPGRESGRVLAKRLVLPEVAGDKATFEYAGLASRFVTADERMTVEEAKAFGHQFGICCVCGALLTDPTSVDAGIGPVCGSRV